MAATKKKGARAPKTVSRAHTPQKSPRKSKPPRPAAPTTAAAPTPIITVPPPRTEPLTAPSTARDSTKSVWPMTALFVVIILLLPFLIDYVAQFVAHLFGAQAVFYFQTRRWLIELAAYVPIYLLMLFYLKTTFNPLATYGYRWSRDYLGWAIYIGLGSGVIMYLVDLVGGLQSLGVPPFSIATAAGYLAGYVLLPALTEETLFRGVMQHFYQGRLTTTISPYHIHVGVFIASAFELAFHLSAPIYYGITTIGVGAAILKTLPQLLYVLVFGAIGGYLYQRTNSLAAPIIIHALGNATEFMLIWATMH